MPTVCKIIFENADNVFYGGQLMIGHVGLTLTKAKVLRGNKIKSVTSGVEHRSAASVIVAGPKALEIMRKNTRAMRRI